MVDLIGWLIVGLIAGALARLVVPGRDPMGWVGTLVLGLLGSLVGGLIGAMLLAGDQEGFSPAGLIGSIIGAIALLIVYRAVTSRSRAT